MPPKQQKKKQEKIIEDRTFGLKNKNKSKAVQKYVKGVQNTVKNQGKSATLLQSQKFQKQKQKKKDQQQQALLNSIYKDVKTLKKQEQQQQDPKSIVCPYFKQGLCQRGKKCIYSHDLTLDRNQQIDLYVDQRTQLIMNQLGAKLSDLSEQQLNALITDKQKQYIKGQKSDIVCKYFLEAVEKDKYGWNWTCANGDSCKYKHCLPPGYILNKDTTLSKNQAENQNIEEKIDEQRNRFYHQKKQSPLVTYEIFLKWKQAKIQRKKQEEEKKKKQEEKKNKNKTALRTGKQLFTYDPTLFIDDEEAADDYEEREQIVEEEQLTQQTKKQSTENDIEQQTPQDRQGLQKIEEQQTEQTEQKEQMEKQGNRIEN